MNQPFKIILALAVMLTVGIIAVLCHFIVHIPAYTEGGYVLVWSISGISIQLITFFLLYKIAENMERNTAKEVNNLKKAALEAEQNAIKESNSLKEMLLEVNNLKKAALEAEQNAIKESNSLKEMLLELEEKNNNNFYVNNYRLEWLIQELRDKSIVDKEFQRKHILAIARYQLKSKSNLDKEKAILTMRAYGGETEVKWLADLFDEPNLDEGIKKKASAALKEIFERVGGKREVNTLIDVLGAPSLDENIRETTKADLKDIYKRLEP